MIIKALQAIAIRDPETGDLMSIAYGTVADVPDAVGRSLIADGIAEKYDGGGGSFTFEEGTFTFESELASGDTYECRFAGHHEASPNFLVVSRESYRDTFAEEKNGIFVYSVANLASIMQWDTLPQSSSTYGYHVDGVLNYIRKTATANPTLEAYSSNLFHERGDLAGRVTGEGFVITASSGVAWKEGTYTWKAFWLSETDSREEPIDISDGDEPIK